MKYQNLLNTTTALLIVGMALPAAAHDGRRFEVKVVDNRIVAHGYISGAGAIDDGGGLVRAYYNALHGHFDNITESLALADLPGFDLDDEADALIGYDLIWTATGFHRWASPTTSGPVELVGMPRDEVIEVKLGEVSVFSDALESGPTSLTLLSDFDGDNGLDLDLSYRFRGPNPVGELFVIESVLRTDAPGIADSASVYTILSPDGSTPMQKLHHPSLYLESVLGSAVPEPASGLGLCVLLGLGLGRRRTN
ncbi:MAG: PEP-CTERM sorting domain-containing protein [Phycisphaeraceae bacterium]